MKYVLRFPESVIERDGPFKEFKQDGSIVSVELEDGTIFESVLLVYPNIIGAMPGVDSVPFAAAQVRRVFQTEDNLASRSSSDWTFFLNNKEAESGRSRD